MESKGEAEKEKKEKKESDMSLKDLIFEKASNTGMHGVPNVHRAHSFCRRAFWSALVFAGLGMMLWQIILAFLKYQTHPVDTSILFNASTEAEFPAVTLCNLNPIRNSTREQNAVLDQMLAQLSATGNDIPSSPPVAPDPDADEAPEETASEGYLQVTDFLAAVQEFPAPERRRIGHQLSDMLVSCSFKGVPCQLREFKTFSNYMYGNCYSYNVEREANKSVKTVNKPGPLTALSLTVHVQQDEYVGQLSPAAGLRLLIHNHTHMPFPEDDGINVMPGTKTSIAIRKVVHLRSRPPWGECEEFDATENEMKNAYLYHNPHINYTALACQKTCYQHHILLECGCFDPNLPYDLENNIPAYTDLPENRTYRPCLRLMDNEDIQNCVDLMERQFSNNELECTTKCPEKCYETVYEYAASHAVYPSQKSTGMLFKELAESSQGMWNVMNSMQWDESALQSFVANNILSVEIYFGDMTVEVIETKPSYLALDLISDLGGQAGLWVGVSMIALFELIELVIDICIIVAKRCKPTQQINSMSELETVRNADSPS